MAECIYLRTFISKHPQKEIVSHPKTDTTRRAYDIFSSRNLQTQLKYVWQVKAAKSAKKKEKKQEVRKELSFLTGS